MKAFFLAAIFLLATVSHAQSLVQPSVAHDCGASVSCSASLANPVSLGNTLLAIVRLGTTTASATSVSDSLGNAYALDAAVAQTIDGHSLLVYRAQIAASGLATVSITNKSASTVRIIGFAEVAGLTGALDGINKAIGSSNAPQPGAIAPTQTNDYLLIAASTADNESFAASGGFQTEQALSKGAFADLMQPTAGAVSGSMKLSSANQWAAVAVAYKTTPRLPLSFQLNYSDGTPVQGTVQLCKGSGTSATPITTWPIGPTGSVAGYLPLANTGTYSYTALDPTGKQLQAITVLPGAFAVLGGLHSIHGTVTLDKSTDSLVMPASLALQ